MSKYSLDVGVRALAEADAACAAAVADEEEAGILRLCERLRTEALYERHVERQKEEVAELRRDLSLALPADLDLHHVYLRALSDEEREKLGAARPTSVAAAARIPGITPKALITLLRFVKKSSAADTSEKGEEKITN